MNLLRFALVLSCVSFAFAEIQPKKSKMILEHMTKLYQIARPVCILETRIDEKKVQVLESVQPVDDKNIYCFVGCIMKYMNIIDEKGRLQKWQLVDVLDALMGDGLNENAKYVLKTVVKRLQQSKHVCEAGKIAIKLMETIFYQNIEYML
ncbi:uncharacterized protein LOC129565881 isoform X1 [Sitodiplosis mosellana]|uniref:uncharacterized protein LOC129565881 isoform X1 n=1 Tax=Sitodiplosis mosellana TaxID=263140 RepID=UPI0024439A47|nr:uncharacterized protein LOC129565881 isoform X1 [Sitodiplosis mosellana]